MLFLYQEVLRLLYYDHIRLSWCKCHRAIVSVLIRFLDTKETLNKTDTLSSRLLSCSAANLQQQQICDTCCVRNSLGWQLQNLAAAGAGQI